MPVILEARSIDLSHGNFHYYTKAVADNTSLFMFGSGLGEQAVIYQMVMAFKKLVESEGDPDLGRIVVSIGIAETSHMAFYGDVNLHWICNSHFCDNIKVNSYVEKRLVKPDAFLCSTRILEAMLNCDGLNTLFLPFGVGEIFHPLKLPREGLGYSGVKRDEPEQHIILTPFLDDPRFEWVTQNQGDAVSFEELNEWYNSKQIVFGICTALSRRLGLVSNRMFESLATGTPYVSSLMVDSEYILDHYYPYQSKSAEETVDLVEGMLDDYPRVLEEFARYSKHVRKEHSYVNRLRTLFMFLEKRM